MDPEIEHEATSPKVRPLSQNYETVEIPKIKHKPVSPSASKRYPVAQNLPVPSITQRQSDDTPRSQRNLPVPSDRVPSDWDLEPSSSLGKPSHSLYQEIIKEEDAVGDYPSSNDYAISESSTAAKSDYCPDESDEDSDLENHIVTFHQKTLEENLHTGNLEHAEASLRGILSHCGSVRRRSENNDPATKAKWILQLADIQGRRRKSADALNTIRTLNPNHLPPDLLPVFHHALSLYLFAVSETEAAEAICKKAVILARKEVKRSPSKENLFISDKCSYLMARILESTGQDAEARAFKALVSPGFHPDHLDSAMAEPKPPESEDIHEEDLEALSPSTAGTSPSILSGSSSIDNRYSNPSLQRFGLAVHDGMIVDLKSVVKPNSPNLNKGGKFSMPAKLTRRSSSRRSDSFSAYRKSAETLNGDKKLHRLIQKAMTTAIQENDVAVMDVLLTDPSVAKAKFTIGDGGWTPLHEVCKQGNADMVRTFLTHSVDTTVVDRMGNSPLLTALQTMTETADELVPLLLNHGANPNHCNGNGDSPMMLAAIAGHVRCAATLREHKARINVKNRLGWTPLHLAARWGGSPESSARMVEFLLNNGAQPSPKDMGGRTPLQLLMEEPNWRMNKRHVSNILMNRDGV